MSSIWNSSSHKTWTIHHAHSRTSNVEASGTLQRRRTYTNCPEYHRCLTQCWIRAQPILGTLVGNLRKAAPNSESPSHTERQRRSWTSKSGGSFKWSSSTSDVSSKRFSSRPDLIRRKESPCKWRQTNSTCLVQLPDPSRQESVPFSTWRILLDMRKPSMPGMPPRKIGHIFQCLSVLLASCPLSLLTSCACQGSKPPLSRKRPQHPTNPQALSCFSPLLCRWKSFLFGSLPFDFQVPADRIYWLSCSGDTVVEGPKKLGTANLASWYYNQQIPKRTLLSQLLGSGLTCSARSSQMYCRTNLQLRSLCRLMDESQKLSLKKHFK